MYIPLAYPTPTFCLQKWVEPGGWCRKSGAGPAEPGIVCPRGPASDSDRWKGTCECAALFTANTYISGCLRHQEGQRKYN